MIRSLTVSQMGARIDQIDEFILILIAQRMRLSLNVAAWKGSQEPPQPIFRKDKEDERLRNAMVIGEKLGLKPNFVFAMLYTLIGESCKEQMIELQGKFKRLPDVKDDEWFDLLKQNLLELTEIIAPTYDEEYVGEFFASQQYREFEKRMIARDADLTGPCDFAIDLGCATGEQTFHLATRFEKVVGYDVSSTMIDQANRRLELSKEHFPYVSFEQVDLEQGIPLPDNSVSFVLMNLGTASDIRNITGLITEIERVLVVGGGFFLSFYNADALVYKWGFLPWPLAVAAEVNRDKQCLDVHVGEKIFSVPARPYKIEEINNLFPNSLDVTEILTYPTIGSVLPNRLFSTEEVRVAVSDADEHLSSLELGAYAIASGVKKD